jgi:hypothetical protein
MYIDQSRAGELGGDRPQGNALAGLGIAAMELFDQCDEKRSGLSTRITLTPFRDAIEHGQEAGPLGDGICAAHGLA